jgi:uncharacterized protein (TIGR03086 family)
MDRTEMLQHTVDGAKAMVARVRSDELARPTPCTEWDVRGLVGHMIDVCSMFGAALGAKTGGQPSGAAAARDDLAAAYAEASSRLMAGWHRPGVREQTLKLPFGEMPGEVAINVVLADQLLHTWDLAKALGRPYSIDADLAEAVLQMMQKMMRPEFRGPGKGFAEEVPCPPDASVQDRLLAFSGRRP